MLGGGDDFVLKIVLIWILVTVVMVECGRQKKDVHHMIILKEKPQTGGRRHKETVVSSHRTKRKPAKKQKAKEPVSSSSAEESSEEDSYELEKPKSKRHRKRKNPQHQYATNPYYAPPQYPNFQNFIPQSYPTTASYPFSDAKWAPMTSQELFASVNSPHPSGIFNGAIAGGVITGAAVHRSVPRYSQPIPMEITTPYTASLAAGTFVGSRYDTGTQTEAYRPYDYSVLEQLSTSASATDVGSRYAVQENVLNDTQLNGSGTTAFSIIVDEETMSGGKEVVNEKQRKPSIGDSPKSGGRKTKRKPRDRGTSRFRTRRGTFYSVPLY